MKKFLSFFVAAVSLLFSASASAGAEKSTGSERPLRVLLIGNSFANSLREELPRVVQSVPGCKLELGIAQIGGCSLERHVKEYEKSAKDPSHHPYSKKYALQDFLAKEWDIISIQQHSLKSPDWSTYQPWADKLIAIIRKTNPKAEIIIQQTWSYNAGSPRLAYEFHYDQDEMYRRLADCYRKLAEEKGFRVVPVGLAVQNSRVNHPKQFPVLLKKDMDAIGRGEKELPVNEDVVGRGSWTTKGEKRYYVDTIHLNQRGKYLQSCVWFGFLFQRPVSDVTYVQKGMTAEDAAFLKQCAQKALDEYQQVLKK